MTWPIGTDDRHNVQDWEKGLPLPLDPEIAPTVRFHGGQGEGMRVLGIALQHGLKVTALRRYWQILDGEPHGPHWEMTF